jgi:uncharacterized coiled-coil protein SlyX
MLTPPPTLTPMERQLLHRVQELQHGLMTHLAEQDRKIAALEAEIRARDPSLDRLTDTLRRLLGPLDRDGSLPS